MQITYSNKPSKMQIRCNSKLSNSLKLTDMPKRNGRHNHCNINYDTKDQYRYSDFCRQRSKVNYQRHGHDNSGGHKQDQVHTGEGYDCNC